LEVASSADWAMLSAEESDMRIFHGPAPVVYLFRLTRTSMRSEPVWKTFELAV
jgi:hypothetical protein